MTVSPFRTSRPAARTAAALAVLALVSLAACGDQTSSPAPTAAWSAASAASVESTPTTSSASSAPSALTGDHNEADAAFLTQMIPHHEQAVTMSAILLAKSGVDPDVRKLATSIKDEQQPEIDEMIGWLQEWGVAVPKGMETMDPSAPATGGMMSNAEMAALNNADGPEAQTLYLQGMIRHHQGAIAMAQTEIDQGTNIDAKTLAAQIVTSQSAQIEDMNKLLGG